MAERRMFAKAIIDSDAFLDMPTSAQALYFHLAMRADDDGFINNPRRIQRTVGASADDLKLLVAKQFIIPFDTGIVVIRHWRIHNYIQSDRYKATLCQAEKAMLTTDETKAYEVMDTGCIQDVSKPDTQVRLGKDSLGKDSKEKGEKRFAPPSIEEVKAYCEGRKNSVDPEAFIDFYASKGWKVGNQPMKDWKAAIRTWERRDDRPKASAPARKTSFHNFEQRESAGGSWDELEVFHPEGHDDRTIEEMLADMRTRRKK